MLKKLLFLILVGAFVLVIGAHASTQKGVTLSGLQIAEKTLSFTETFEEQPNGLLTYNRVCDEQGCEFAENAFPQTRAWLVLAYTGLYEATGSEQLRQKIVASMAELQEECPSSATSLLEDCGFIGVQTEEAYQAIGEPKYLEYISFFAGSPVVRAAPDALSVMMSSIQGRQAALAYKYGFHTSPLSVKVGYEYLYRNALDNHEPLITVHTEPFKQSACWAYLAEIELAKTLAELPGDAIVWQEVTAAQAQKSMLAEPRDFFDSFSFAGMNKSPYVYALSLTDLESCAEAALGMYEVTGQKQYQGQAIAILQGMLDRHWDSEYSTKHVGDNAFLAQGCRPLAQDGDFACYNNNNVLTDNAYAVYLFSQVPDQTFIIEPVGQVVNYTHPAADPTAPTVGQLVQSIRDRFLDRIFHFLAILALLGILFWWIDYVYRKSFSTPSKKL